MNKRTRAIDEDTYKLIIATMKNGFTHEGVPYKPNERIATVLVLEYNLGLRVGDILQLKVDSFVKDGSRYRLDMYEQKTGKYRNFTVPVEVYSYVRDYAYGYGRPLAVWLIDKGYLVKDVNTAISHLLIRTLFQMISANYFCPNPLL